MITRKWSRLAVAVALAICAPAAAQVRYADYVVAEEGWWGGCAVTRSGKLRCWGEGGPAPIDSDDEVEVEGLTEVVGVSIEAKCALRRNGEAWCWKDGKLERVGGLPRPVVQIDQTCVVDDRGHVYDLRAGRPRRIEAFSHVARVACPDPQEGAHTCAVTTSGTVRCIGANDEGQLGRSPEASTPADVPGIQDAVSVAVTSTNTCALLRSGKVACWGSDEDGQNGDGEDQAPPGKITFVRGLTDAVALFGERWGATYCAVRRGGEVACWGRTLSLVVPEEKDFVESPKTIPALRDVSYVTFGAHRTCFVTKGRIQCLGSIIRRRPTQVLQMRLPPKVAACAAWAGTSTARSASPVRNRSSMSSSRSPACEAWPRSPPPA